MLCVAGAGYFQAEHLYFAAYKSKPALHKSALGSFFLSYFPSYPPFIVLVVAFTPPSLPFRLPSILSIHHSWYKSLSSLLHPSGAFSAVSFCH